MKARRGLREVIPFPAELLRGFSPLDVNTDVEVLRLRPAEEGILPLTLPCWLSR